MVVRTETGERVSSSAVQLAGWQGAAAYIARLGELTGRRELVALADEVLGEGDELYAELVAHERLVIAAYC